MKIKMLTLLAGPAGIMQPGQIYDVPAEQATSLAAAGYAQLLETPAPRPVPPVIETAAIPVPEPPIEMAVKPRARRKS